MKQIDWTNPKDHISRYFTVHDATYLPKWQIYHQPSEIEKANILKLAAKLDSIMDFLGHRVVVHCFIRPTSVNCPESFHNGQNYNLAIGSTATRSAHIVGMACDLHVQGFEGAIGCDDIRTQLVPELEPLKLRMEQASGDHTWVHLDMAPVISTRYFKP